jgi:hypothetical protein
LTAISENATLNASWLFARTVSKNNSCGFSPQPG